MKDSIDAVLSVYYTEIKTNQKLIKNLDKAITDIVQALLKREYCSLFAELDQFTLLASSLKLVVLIGSILKLSWLNTPA